MPRFRLMITAVVCAAAAAMPAAAQSYSIAPPGLPAAGASTAYYVDVVNGSDANPCTQAKPCKTLVRVLGGQKVLGTFTPGLIPFALAQTFNIHVAHGTYPEGIYAGFGTAAQKINIIGDSASPSSVIFNGTIGCDFINDLSAASTPTVYCNTGSNVAIIGLTLNGSTGNRAAMTYHDGHTVMAAVNLKGIGETTDVSYVCESTTGSLVELFSPINLDMTDASNTGGQGFEANTNSVITWYGSAAAEPLTITGPGGASVAEAIHVTRASIFDVHKVTGNTASQLRISNFGTGIYVCCGSTFADRTSSVNPGIIISRSAGTTGTGIYVEAGFYFANTGGLQLTNLATGLLTDSNGTIMQKSCAWTNVNTHSSGTSFTPSCF